MAANSNWQRWTYATYTKSLLADVPSTPMSIEFFNPKRTPAGENATTNAEVTISGPRTRRLSPHSHVVFVDVFVVVTSNIQSNNYGHLTVVGNFEVALEKCFAVMDYGSEIGDTGLVEVGLLRLRSVTEDAEGIDVTHLKPAKDDTQIHTTLLARYSGRFRS